MRATVTFRFRPARAPGGLGNLDAPNYSGFWMPGRWAVVHAGLLSSLTPGANFLYSYLPNFAVKLENAL